MKPVTTAMTMVQPRERCGIASANGAAPRMEMRMMRLRPNLSPSAPPMTVPAAKAARYAKRQSCACLTPSANLSIRKKVK